MRKRTLTLLGLWTLLVLYPNPYLLVASLQRAWAPPVDPSAVRELAATLPDAPAQIEQIVNTTLVPYAVPWQTYGIPWYFPTPAEVLARGQGDCQARAVLLASLLRAKGIPARLAGSFDHLWVEYPGKAATTDENALVAVVAQDADGRYRFRLPAIVNWRQSWTIERMYFWDAMPSSRFWLLVLGWTALGVLPRTCRRGLVHDWRRSIPAAANDRSSL